MSTDFDYNNFSVDMMECLDSLFDEFNCYFDDDDAHFYKDEINEKFDRLFKLYKEFDEKW